MGRSHRQGGRKTGVGQLGLCRVARSGRFDRISFRFGAWSVWILRSLLAVFFDALFYYAVWNCKHTIYKLRETVVIGGMFHYFPLCPKVLVCTILVRQLDNAFSKRLRSDNVSIEVPG